MRRKARPSESNAGDNNESGPEDGLVENYRTILNELGTLTTVYVLLFGFLLTGAETFLNRTLEEVLYSVAIVIVATATLVFSLPVAYDHLQFPYCNFEKFDERTHVWIIIGLPLLGGRLYLSLSLAIWSLLDFWALGASALPLAGTHGALLARRKMADQTDGN